MGLVTSQGAKGMPRVVEADPTEVPEVLEIVEVRPGVRLKLNKADRKIWEQHMAAEKASAPAPEPTAEEDEDEPVPYPDLQARAQELGIPANQSRIKLEKAIAAAEEEG